MDDEENQLNSTMFKSVFTDQTKFFSDAHISIEPPTNDGICVAYILFNNLQDVKTAGEMYQNINDSDRLQYGRYQCF